MQQLRLRLYSGEGSDVVIIANDGPDDIVVDGFVLPPGYFLEHIATPYIHPTGIFPLPQNERLLATIVEGSAISSDPPPYGAGYRRHPSN
jgi:hypothetical protein